jgi:very-short-patch-repair endonuclease
MPQQKGKHSSPATEFKSGVNHPLYGKKLPETTRKKISLANKGKSKPPFSETHKKKLSLINKGKHPLSEFKKGQTPWNKGKKGLQVSWCKGKKAPQISKSKLGHIVSKETRRKISIAHTGKILSESHKEKIKKARANQILPVRDTKPEKALQNALNSIGIHYIPHKVIHLSDETNHQVDLFIEPNICIEVDGDYWHNRPESKIRDAFINRDLEIKGYKVYRFWEHDIIDE